MWTLDMQNGMITNKFTQWNDLIENMSETLWLNQIIMNVYYNFLHYESKLSALHSKGLPSFETCA